MTVLIYFFQAAFSSLNTTYNKIYIILKKM